MPRGGARPGAGRPTGTGFVGVPQIPMRIPVSFARRIQALQRRVADWPPHERLKAMRALVCGAPLIITRQGFERLMAAKAQTIDIDRIYKTQGKKDM